jgi:hypothetical protein
MVFVKEATMKPRTRTLSAVSATIATAGLVLGLAFGGSSAASNTTPSTTTTVSTPRSQMPGMDSMMTGDMDSMMTGGTDSMMTGDMNEMTSMMGPADMSAMHSTMHQMMEGIVDDDVLAACDTAHEEMADSMTAMSDQGDPQHGAHHGVTRS